MLENSDSKKYLNVIFFQTKSKICNMFGTMHRMAMRDSVFKSTDLKGPSRYVKHIPF